MTSRVPAVAVDTNVLVYAEGYGDESRKSIAVQLLRSLNTDGFTLPLQVAGEFLRVMRRKFRLSPHQSASRLDELSASAVWAPTSTVAFGLARTLSAEHGLDVWDAVVLSVAADAGCRILLSEDMQDGFTWAGCTVINPFAIPPHPLLATAIATGDLT